MFPGRRAVVGVIAVVALVLLSACASTEKEATMTPHEARDTLMKIAHDTASLLDITGWTADSAPDVGGCDASIPSVNYGYGYSAQPGTDHLGDALKVAAYWKKLGMSVRVVKDPEPTVYATGGPIHGLAFSSAPGLYYIAGTSLCVPGDVDKLIHEQAGE